jgi:integrase/recombinase XerD
LPCCTSGVWAGEALGPQHEDIAAAERETSIVSRENANRARAKSGRTVLASGDLICLYVNYLHEEYGGTDSDYVFHQPVRRAAGAGMVQCGGL